MPFTNGVGPFPQLGLRQILPILLGCQPASRLIGMNDSRMRLGFVHDRLLDHLIRPRQQRRRDGEAEGLRGLQVDDEVEFRRLLNRKIARLGALENLIHIIGGASEKIEIIWRVRHQAPGWDNAWGSVHRR